LMLVQIIYFVAYTIQMSAILALTFEGVSEDMRGAVFGVIQVTRAVVTVFASLIVGYLVNFHADYRLAYYACLIIAIVGLLTSWWLKTSENPPCNMTGDTGLAAADVSISHHRAGES
ncbi:MAG: hypothetical protein ACP5I8_15215, partial [Phycisphaerae bacterium]